MKGGECWSLVLGTSCGARHWCGEGVGRKSLNLSLRASHWLNQKSEGKRALGRLSTEGTEQRRVDSGSGRANHCTRRYLGMERASKGLL